MAEDDWAIDGDAETKNTEVNKPTIVKIRSIKSGGLFTPADKYTTAQLYAATAHHAIASDWRPIGAVNLDTDGVSAGNKATVRELFARDEQKGIAIITPPASDDPGPSSDPEGHGSNGYSISQAVQDAIKASGGKRPLTISTKIAQEQPTELTGIRRMVRQIANLFRAADKKLPLNPPRDHWTHLSIRIDQQNKIEVVHTDSMREGNYNLQPIRQEIRRAFADQKIPIKDEQFTFTAKYTGKQHDWWNCGRFASAAEQACLYGDKHAIDNPLKYARESMHIDHMCNTYQGKYLDSALYNKPRPLHSHAIASEQRKGNAIEQKTTSQSVHAPASKEQRQSNTKQKTQLQTTQRKTKRQAKLMQESLIHHQPPRNVAKYKSSKGKGQHKTWAR